MAVTAAEVKRLREETGAPMMDVKAALVEAKGDSDKAKKILKEKGKAAAAKRADRGTSQGLVAFAASRDKKTVGGIVLESETDFVARNPEFIALANSLAELARDKGITDPNDPAVKPKIEEAIAKIRENIRLAKAVQLKSDSPIAWYVHHDGKVGVAILSKGEHAGSDEVRKVAIHAAWSLPEVISKDQLSQEKIKEEIETETQRAINDGKPANIARNIAQGRVNKEFVRRVVLLEQPFYSDLSKSVSQFLSENAKGTTITGFEVLAVGQK